MFVNNFILMKYFQFVYKRLFRSVINNCNRKWN